ncbi:MAG: hypothetical protein LC749_01410 [Actinobacteria bacterium]|nr:hypothetical protein [Actinomycetota bacterium]
MNGLFVFTVVNNFYLIGTAGAPSYQVHVVLHDTINAEGDYAANVLTIRVTCQ